MYLFGVAGIAFFYYPKLYSSFYQNSTVSVIIFFNPPYQFFDILGFDILNKSIKIQKTPKAPKTKKAVKVFQNKNTTKHFTGRRKVIW